MATFVYYNTFSGDVGAGVHDLDGTAGAGANTLKVALTNTAPNVATHAVRADVTEISAGNGYTSGGVSIANVGSRSGGTFTVVGTDQTFTASGGSMAAFRYAFVYNDTPTSPADPLVGYWDYGSSITLASGQTFTVDLGPSLIVIG